MILNKIYNEPCIHTMSKMKDNFIDLVVTSPPYDDLRAYKNNVGLKWSEKIWKPIIKELYRVLKVGGIVVWIVADKTEAGSETGTSFKQALFAMECGFNLYDTMFYQKASRIPTESRYYNTIEYMFVFSKGKPKTLNFIKDHKNKTQGQRKQKDACINKGKNKKKEGYIVTGEYSRRSNVWTYGTGMPTDLKQIFKSKKLKHPAIFPENLAEDHICSWSNENDLIYDPFMGSGTVAKMAHIHNRNFIGSEISSEYVEISNKRLKPYLDQMRMF